MNSRKAKIIAFNNSLLTDKEMYYIVYLLFQFFLQTTLHKTFYMSIYLCPVLYSVDQCPVQYFQMLYSVDQYLRTVHFTQIPFFVVNLDQHYPYIVLSVIHTHSVDQLPFTVQFSSVNTDQYLVHCCSLRYSTSQCVHTVMFSSVQLMLIEQLCTVSIQLFTYSAVRCL